ncbi:hypothetical protein REPUB_Repub15cG0061700 [Reevesia pubescens]
MLSLGISPDKYTFPFLLSACTKISASAEGFQVHGSFIKMDFQGDMYILNSLIHFYAECGEIVLGRKVFDEMTERNVVSWTSLICGYARWGFTKEAVELFFEMVEEGTRPNSVTMVCVISACTKLKDLELGERACGYIDELGVKVNTLMVNALVDMYMKCGAFDTAKRLFDECGEKNLRLMPDRVTMLSTISACARIGSILLGKCCHGYVLRNGLEGYIRNGNVASAWEVFNNMPESDLVSWNTIVSALVQESMFKEAIELFRIMQNEGIKADRVTMVSIASACGYLGALDLAKCGDPLSAMEVFNKMEKRDVSAWTAAIGAMAMEVNGNQAIELFNEMLSQGVKPDGVAFVGLLTACGH